MAKRHKYTNQEVFEMYLKKMTNLTETAKALGVTRRTLYKWMDKDAELKEMMESATETMIDMVETKLYSKIMKGDTASIIFFLKTKAKHRGYSEKVQVENIGEQKPQVVIMLPDNKRQDD